MSIPLLKKSLELANSDYKENNQKKGNSRSSNNKNKIKLHHRQTNPYDLRGIGDVKSCHINKLRQVKRKISKSKRKLKKAAEKLERLKEPCFDKKLANKILERNNKPIIEDYIPVQEPQGTVFTEEDFENFEEMLRNES